MQQQQQHIIWQITRGGKQMHLSKAMCYCFVGMECAVASCKTHSNNK